MAAGKKEDLKQIYVSQLPMLHVMTDKSGLWADGSCDSLPTRHEKKNALGPLAVLNKSSLHVYDAQ